MGTKHWMESTKAHGQSYRCACLVPRVSFQYVLGIDYEIALILANKQTNANHIHWLLLSSCFFLSSSTSSSAVVHTAMNFTQTKWNFLRFQILVKKRWMRNREKKKKKQTKKKTTTTKAKERNRNSNQRAFIWQDQSPHWGQKFGGNRKTRFY